MAATVTLTSTTFVTTANANDAQVQLTSLSGLVPGMCLFVDRELMKYLSPGIGNWINVQRGVEGTHARRHSTASTVYMGRPDQFYTQDPSGLPNVPVAVNPWINVINGTVWLAAEDGASAWTQVFANAGTAVTTITTGALGIQQTTVTQ